MSARILRGLHPLTLALGAVVLMSSACEGDDPPPPAAPPPSRPVPTPEPPPQPETATLDDEIAYVYSPIGKRDPFRSIYEKFQDEEGQRTVTPLQKFELDQLKLVGIVSRIATPYAMVEDPNGKGHTLTRGKLIGKNWGRVSQITSDCVTIKEEYRDYTGRKVTNTTDMCIPKPADLEAE
ncbi:MAG: pilus assembly protein PilP [Myxococcota bacterium]